MNMFREPASADLFLFFFSVRIRRFFLVLENDSGPTLRIFRRASSGLDLGEEVELWRRLVFGDQLLFDVVSDDRETGPRGEACTVNRTAGVRS